ncbi:hypothetical protein OSTOST_23470 [Ostertagia ostertagi]
MNMCVGERRILVVPPHLAYGGRPSHPKVPGTEFPFWMRARETGEDDEINSAASSLTNS